MMGQLMGKEVLYEPLKELSDKVSIFPCLVPYLLMVLSTVPVLSRFECGQTLGVGPSKTQGATRVRLKNHCSLRRPWV
jgi:hypothetical protein